LNLNGKFKNKIKQIDVQKISLSDAKLRLSPAKEVVRNPKLFNKLFANITGLKIDSLEKKDERILNSDDMNIWVEEYSKDFAGNLYTIFFKNLGISTGKNKIYSTGLELNPRLPREEYGEIKKKENSLSYLKLSDVEVLDFDIKSFIEKGDLIAKSAEIENLQFHTYKNNRYPSDSILKVALPLKNLMNYQKLIRIDSINFKDAYLGHEILGQDAHENGFVDFTRINGGIYNFTNSREAILGKQNTTMVASGYFMDKSLFTASFHFPLDSKYGEYYYGGELDTFEMQELNPILENLAFISVTDGIVHHLKFEVSANEDYAEGKLKMLYKDLKIELLNKKRTDSIETEKRELFSMVANSILRNSNPKHKNGFIKEGRIYFERNVFKPVFNYWILSVLSGIKSTLGFKSKELKERLKIEKSTEKYSSRKIKKTARFDRKNEKAQQKQIDKEIKQELKKRKRSGNRIKNNKNQEKIQAKSLPMNNN
jgi:hypothetical protein